MQSFENFDAKICKKIFSASPRGDDGMCKNTKNTRLIATPRGSHHTALEPFLFLHSLFTTGAVAILIEYLKQII